jgi:hypothetical protein
MDEISKKEAKIELSYLITKTSTRKVIKAGVKVDYPVKESNEVIRKWKNVNPMNINRALKIPTKIEEDFDFNTITCYEEI